jgi:YD repeat-containing protein
VSTQCNPAFSGTSSATDGCFTNAYDTLGRLLSTTGPDQSQPSRTYTNLSSPAPGHAVVTVRDEAGKERRLRHDGLGRLIQADEGPSFGWTTAYTYDALDNLNQVNQSTQTPRTFVYDSLKRLLRATNPENATTSYAYDLNGNLASRSDARGAISCFGTLNGTTCDSSTGYDTLDRPVKTTYTGTCPPQ